LPNIKQVNILLAAIYTAEVNKTLEMTEKHWKRNTTKNT